MKNSPVVSLIGALVLLVLVDTAAPAGLPSYRPLSEVLSPEDPGRNFPMEWKTTWGETARANARERWEKELKELKVAAPQLKRHLAVRTVVFLEAMMKRFPEATEKHIEAARQIAASYLSLGDRVRHHLYQKKLAEDFPGRVDVAATALVRILETTPWAKPEQTPSGEAWVEYAAGRLIALDRAGLLPGGHAAVELARKVRFTRLMAQGRFIEARHTLELPAWRAKPTARDPWWEAKEGGLLLAAGHAEKAAKFYEKLGDPAQADAALAQAAAPPDFPRHLALEMRWEAARGGRMLGDPKGVHDMLKAGAKEDSLLRKEESLRSSIWTEFDLDLLAQEPGALIPLREAQEKQVETIYGDPSRKAMTYAEVVALYRGYPWAQSVHQALVKCGERALKEGRSGWALRTFKDVLSHASDPELRARAHVGLWLALLDVAPTDLRTALDAVPDNTPLPWRGKPAPASVIKKELRALVAVKAGAAGGSPPKLAQLQRKVLRLPAARAWADEGREADFPWPLGQISAFGKNGNKLLLSGPDLLACYAGDLSKPLWLRTPARPDALFARGRKQSLIRGPFVPAVADGVIYSRWGKDASGHYLTDLAAFRADTGQMLWSTAEGPSSSGGWQEVRPVNDPTVADGRGYLLGIPSRPGLMSAVDLLCLDVRNGKLLWKRTLGLQRLSLLGAELSHYGNPVTIDRGAVYCSTNLGLVARCDARDGLAEWVRAYPRTVARSSLRNICRRQGSAPVVVGEAVLFAPRDYNGVFGVHRKTGEVLWENPFVPSDTVVGRAGKVVILTDAHWLAAIDASSGRELWSRCFGRIGGHPTVVGSDVLLYAGNRLCRISAQTGETLEELALAKDGPPVEDVIFPPGTAIVVTADPPPPVREQQPEAGAAPPKAPDPLRLPLARTWTLARPNPSLFFPPAEANTPRAFYVFSAETLSKVETEPFGEVAWQRVLPDGFTEAMWTNRAILIRRHGRVTALDIRSGATLWKADVPFEVRHWGIGGRHLFVGDLGSANAGVIDLANGKLLWHRSFHEPQRFGGLAAFRWRGEELHLIAPGARFGNGQLLGDISVRASDGRIVQVKPLLGEKEGRPSGPAFGDGFVFFVSSQRVAREMSLVDGKALDYKVDLKPLDPRRFTRFIIEGPWLQMSWVQGNNRKHWVLRRGDPAYAVERPRPGVIRGNKLYEKTDGALVEFDLTTKKEMTYRLPLHGKTGIECTVLDWTQGPGGVEKPIIVVSAIRETYRYYPPDKAKVRVDVFDPKTGAHLAAQTLPAVAYCQPAGADYQTQVATVDGILYVTDLNGVHAFKPGEAEATGSAFVVHRTSQPITVDGSLNEWQSGKAIPLVGSGKDKGELKLAHDGVNLYLAVSHRADRHLPYAGRGKYSAGDHVVIGLTTNKGLSEWAIGIDRRGKIVWDSVRGGIPAGRQAAASHRLDNGELIYEIAVPLASVVERGGHWRRIGVFAAVRDEVGGVPGPTPWSRRVLALGGATAPSALAQAHKTVYVHPLTSAGEEAVRQIADTLGTLPDASEAWKHAADIAGDSGEALLRLYAARMRRHSKSISVERLSRMRRQLEPLFERDPSTELLAAAAAAGVPQAVRDNYARRYRKTLSQWVYVAKDKPRPANIVLGLFDGAHWHHMYWGDAPKGNDFLPQRGGGHVQQGKWVELRVPLVAMDMHDKPIWGVSFRQQGPGVVIWDRTAVRSGGKEIILVEDERPPGLAQGKWEWTAQEKHSGAKAHTGPAPKDASGVTGHAVLPLDTPMVAHIDPPAGGDKMLSQWVWLDPNAIPDAIAIGLHDGRTWRALAWGVALPEHRYMGRLPVPGKWHELRVPLAWTTLRSTPISGIYFDQGDGRVSWGPTAVIAGGKTHVIIGDKVPPARVGKEQTWRLGRDTYGGGVRPAPGKLGIGAKFDGKSGCVMAPHSADIDPPNVTVEAWINLEQFPAGEFRTAWIVNKNGDAGTSGHYSLGIEGRRLVGRLNIGGGKANALTAVTGEDPIALGEGQHVAMTYDGLELKLYVNGGQAGSYIPTPPAPKDERKDEEAEAKPVVKNRTPGAGPLFIGRWAAGGWRVRAFADSVHLAGTVDEVRVYKRALTADELKANAAAPKKKLAPALEKAVAGYWGFDNAVGPADPRAEWQWADQAGRKAHTLAPGARGSIHLLKDLQPPITRHLPFDTTAAVAALKKHIPALGASDEARAFSDLLRRLEGAEPPEPRKPAIDAFVHDWHIIGGFPNWSDNRGIDVVYPPETEPFDLAAAYNGSPGPVRWRLFRSNQDLVSFDDRFRPYVEGEMYAVAWIRTARARAVHLDTASDDNIKVFVNRALVYRGNNIVGPRPRQISVPVILPAGWSEVLIKSGQRHGRWGLYFEVRDAATGAPLEDLETSTVPPEGLPRR